MFSSINFDLAKRELTLEAGYGRDRDTIAFTQLVSRSTYRQGSDAYYIELIVKDFGKPRRIIAYGDREWARDDDAARISLIFGGHI